MRRTTPIISLLGLALTISAPSARAADAPAPKVTYQDHILPIFRNICLNCHNPDKKKGSLDLSTYSGVSAGGGGGKVIEPGDPDSSKLYKAVTWAEEPNMPPKGDKLSDKDIAAIRAWIAGGAPETSGSKVAINKPKNNLGIVVSAGKPKGPVAMPRELSIDPVIVARHPCPLTSLAASPWAPVIAIGGQRQIVLYNSDTLEILGIIPFPEGIAYSLHFSANGSLLIAGGGIGAKSGKVVAFDVATGKRVAEVGDEFDAVLASDMSPDQTRIALGTPLKALKIYSTADGSQQHVIKKHTDWVQAVCYSADGRFLASGDRAGGLWVWDAASANEVYNCAGHKAGVTDACFRGDSAVLASASTDGTIKLWNMNDGTLIKTIQAHGGGVMSVAFTHDGHIVSCGHDNVVKLWKPDGAPLKTFERFSDLALRAAPSYDGKRIIAGDFSGAIRVWDAADGKRAGELTANPPTPADQLANFETHLKSLQSDLNKADAELKSAQEHSASIAREIQSANQAHSQAKEDIKSAQKEISAKPTPENRAKISAAKKTLAKAKSEVESTTKAVARLNKQTKPAAERLARAQAAAKDAAAKIESAKGRKARLEASAAKASGKPRG